MIETVIEAQQIVEEYTGDRYLVTEEGNFIKQDNEDRLNKYVTVPPPEEKVDHYTLWNFETEEWYHAPYPDAWAGTSPAVYTRISSRQARLQLIKLGKLDLVNLAIDKLEEPIKSIASVEWEYAIVLDKTHVFIIELFKTLEIDIDEFFTEASEL